MFRLMLLAALVTGAVVISGCTSTSNCSPANCKGCCDSLDLCHASINDNFCGQGGNSCDVCIAGQSCSSAGTCQGTTTTGDGGVIIGADGGVVGGLSVSGRVTYDSVPSTFMPGSTNASLNFAGAVKKPVRNGVIQVVQGTRVIGSSTTDANGNYQVTYASSGITEIRLFAVARTASPVIQVQDNTDGNATWPVSAAVGTLKQIDLHAAHGWTGSAFEANARNASAFAVLDTMYTSAQAFIAARPSVVFPALKVNWSPNNTPQSGDLAQGLIGTSHFNRMSNQIFVLGKAGADIDEFDSHVIAHEWGHFFEFNLSRSDSPGGRHGPGDILDPRIAFGEAWGNALSAMVLNDPVYADCTWSAQGLGCFGWDSEREPTPTDDPTPSAFSESSVLRALYDLYDTTNVNEPYDQLALGLGPIYDTMVGPEKATPSVTTLASFIAGLKAQPTVSATAVDALLANWNIGSIRNEYGRDDSNLSDMFTDATTLPFTGGISLGGGNLPNTWQQNQYYVFEGTGASMTITAQATPDVAITLYQQGKVIQSADKTEGGTETITTPTVSGAPYVVVLTGFGQTPGDYDVSISIQ